MRDDDQVKVALSLKKDMVVNSGWLIESENEEIKDFLTKSLADMQDPDALEYSFEDCLRDILSAYDYGFSITEPVYRLVDGKYHLKSLKTRPPHTWRFIIDDKGKVLKLQQATNSGDQDFKPAKFLHFLYQPEWGNPYGKSDLKAAHESWKTKRFFSRMRAMYGERFATPTRVVRAPASLDTAELTKLYDVAESIQNNTTILIPEGSTVEFVSPAKDSTDFYERAMNDADLRIARSILVPDLMGMSGEKTSGGSYALGDKQFNLFLSSIAKDRLALERKFNLRVIRPLLAANFGPEAEAEWKLKPWKQEDLLEYLKVWVSAVSGKVFKPAQEHVDHFNEVLGFPKGGEVLDPEAIAQKAAEAKADAFKGRQEEAQDGAEKRPAPEPKKFAMADRTPFEAKVDFAAVQEVFEASERSVYPELRKAAKRISADLLDQVRSRGLVGKFKPEAVNDLAPRFLKDMRAIFKGHFVELFREGVDQARKEILPSGTRSFVEADILPAEFLKVVEAESFKAVGDYSTGITKRVKDRVLTAIKTGQSEGEVNRLLRDELEDQTETWINTVVRTKTTEMYNAARKTVWETDPLISQIVTAYQYSAVLDSRTSEVCASLNGKVFEKGDFIGRATPPLHFNCRSILVPVTRYEDYKGWSKYVKPGDEPSVESLKKKGAGLMTDARLPATQAPAIGSYRIETAGDFLAVAAPGAGQRIRVLSVRASNASRNTPTQLGLKDGESAGVKFRETLPGNGGLYARDFRPEAWVLDENVALLINTSAAVPLDCTVEYEIWAADGRVA